MKRSWFSRHPLCFMALYLILYLSAFNFLNTQIHMPHILVHCRLDDLIPFCKYAAIPYFAWFPWIPFTLFFLLWKAPREDFWRLCMPLFSGMTIALACYVTKFVVYILCTPHCRDVIYAAGSGASPPPSLPPPPGLSLPPELPPPALLASETSLS